MALGLSAEAQDLGGHGGPVGALAAAGALVLSGSFDTRAILWDAPEATARRVLRFHDGAVTATAILPDGALATGGQDGRVAIWAATGTEPRLTGTPHRAPVGALAVTPDGGTLLAAGWDGQVQRIELATGAITLDPAHRDRIAGLGVLADGRIVTVGSDLRLTLRAPDLTLLAAADLPDLPNGLAIAGEAVAVVFADGALRSFTPEGALRPERFLTDRPLVAVAASADTVAAAAVDGTVWVLDLPDLGVRHRIEPGQGPVWALALSGETLLTGGADGMIRRWSLASGAPLGTGAAAPAEQFDDGSRGAEIWRACAVCHSLTPEGGNRAGPSLHGIFGRRIASLPGYDFSPALRAMHLTWTPETVAALFERGPESYTPGSRMPEQRLSDPEDRRALTDFLARMTR
ncbi:c-type cytochrome [Rhodovulum strictum]|uniref:C-type cytochrome n=1 Tax=Rhodovulum strictum TaxID=58314 RepID=A0A844BPS6_9RHOB|nr:c-type cytochrome [Rhodovulum strictum]